MKAYFTSLLLHNMIFHMLNTACAWVAYKTSGSATSIAVIGMMQFLPVFLTFIPAGYVSDRFDKRYVVAGAGLGSAIICTCLGYWVTYASKDLSVLYVGVFLFSMTRSFEATSSATLLPELTARVSLSKWVARSSSLKQVAKVAGPLLSGYLIAVSPWPGLVFYTMGATALVASLLILTEMRIIPPGMVMNQLRSPDESGFTKFTAGIKYIYNNKILMGAVGLDVVAGLLGGLAGILPIIATDVLNADASALGWMRSNIAVGSFTASMLLGMFVLDRKIGRYMISSVLLLGLCIVASAFGEDLLSICLILCVFGSLDAFSVNIRQNLIQLGSPSHVRGRVTSANQLFIVVSNQLSDVRGAMSVFFFGLVPTVVVGGFGVIGVAAAWRMLFPQLARLDTFEDVSNCSL